MGAKESGALTIGVVTKPFHFEGTRRMKQALLAIERLKPKVDTIIVVSNEKLLNMIPEEINMEQSFAVADDMLRQGVVGIADIITKTGLVNVDFADIRSVMKDAGTALMGIGIGKGKTVDIDANVIFGALIDETLGDSISMTVLATGFEVS